MTEAEALKLLSARDVWGVDELPDGITPAILYMLDGDGYVRARGVCMVNQNRSEDDDNPPTKAPEPWVSPTRNSGAAGNWEAILARTTRTAWAHPYEVSLTHEGSYAARQVRKKQPA